MSLLDQARSDLHKQSTNNKEWAQAVAFTSPLGQYVTVNCLANKHHVSVNEMGVAVNGKNASVIVTEKALIDAGYTVRNASNEVALIGHKVQWADSSGTSCSYQVSQTYPDETLGLIVCILGDFKE